MKIALPNNDKNERVHAPLEKPARAIADPFRDLVAAQSASGWVLLSAALIAVLAANTPGQDWYYELRHLELGLFIANMSLHMSLQHWVNDGLMAIFFFVLGLELKREVLVGRLSDLKSATTIVFAALGGMIVPALIYFLIAHSADVSAGWAIPLATDTAFALMVLLLLGNHIPVVARAFLVGLAIMDDLGAILVIAFFYTTELDLQWIPPGLFVLTVLGLLNLTGVRSGFFYLLAGLALWIIFLKLGLHGTLAGVVTAAAAPVRPELERISFVKRLKQKIRQFEQEYDSDTSGIIEQPAQQRIAFDVYRVAEKAAPPLSRWEIKIERPASFLVMPIFAFLNAGVALSLPALQKAWNSELSYAILFGLSLGKPLGVWAGARLGQMLGLAELPDTLTWRHIFGLGLLGGIGFTMSLFIATLSFGEGTEQLDIAKQAILSTSICTGLAGYLWLRWMCPND